MLDIILSILHVKYFISPVLIHLYFTITPILEVKKKNDTKKLSDFPKVTQVVIGKSRI